MQKATITRLVSELTEQGAPVAGRAADGHGLQDSGRRSRPSACRTRQEARLARDRRSQAQALCSRPQGQESRHLGRHAGTITQEVKGTGRPQGFEVDIRTQAGGREDSNHWQRRGR